MSLSVTEAFQHRLAQSIGWSKREPAIVATSGGMDSMTLAHALHDMEFTIALAHVNYGLRDRESDADEALVRQWAADRGLPLYVHRVLPEEALGGGSPSIQNRAREIRYAFFDRLKNTHTHYRYLLTAHHRQDQAETVLQRLCRGTALRGMQGIPERRGWIRRPLLWATRNEISAYAIAAGVPWREDSSNDKTDYTRNALRLQVLPLLQTLYPNAIENIAATADRLKEAHGEYEKALEKLRKKLWVQDGDAQKFPVEGLRRSGLMRSFLAEALPRLGGAASGVEEVVKLLDAQSGAAFQTQTHRLLRHGIWIYAIPKETPENSNADAPTVVPLENGVVHFTGGVLNVKFLSPSSGFSVDDPNSIAVPTGLLQAPLFLRRYKTGDYFYPLGMKHKKKIARFFIDQKLPAHLREGAWVLECEKRIVWVIGFRLDNRFRMAHGDEPCVQLTFVPAARS